MRKFVDSPPSPDEVTGPAHRRLTLRPHPDPTTSPWQPRDPYRHAVTGQGWVNEGQVLPDVSLDSGSEIVVTKKLGGIVGLTNESIEDTTLNLTDEVRRVVVDAFSLRGCPGTTILPSAPTRPLSG